MNSLFDVPTLTAPALLESLTARGVTVSVAGDADEQRLHVAHFEALSDADRADIRRLKPELLELLTRPLTGVGVHRWREPTHAPSVAALVRELESAKRGAWVIPSAPLLAIWRELQTFTGAKLTARHLGALARLHDERALVDNNALLDLWAAGLLPDRGHGLPVWREANSTEKKHD